jgi:enterochelin esterase-like enzyme
MEKIKTHIAPLLIYGFLFFVSATALYGLSHWATLYSNLQHTYYSFFQTKEIAHHKSRVEVVHFTSDTLGGSEREVKIYFPEEYDSQPTAHFAVLYLLHGFPGSQDDWLVNANLPHTIDELIDQKKLKPLIVVFPDGNGPVIQDSQYLNATKINQKMMDHIALELVDYIDHTYRTLPNRESRAIGGSSSGAYGAANITLHYPDRFSMVISMSGYFINREHVLDKLLGKNTKAISDNNPLEKIKFTSLPQPMYFLLQIGEEDYSSWIPQQNQFQSLLLSQGATAELETTPGSHGWQAWKANAELVFQFINKYLVISTTPVESSATSKKQTP